VLARIPEPSLTVQEFKQRFPKILQEVYANSVLLYNTSDLELYLIDKFRTLDSSNTYDMFCCLILHILGF
jgi:hypothetical protein